MADQVREVVQELRLSPDAGLFTRCIVCNELVREVSGDDVRDLVPPYVFATQTRFVRCPGCGRVYWSATHVERAKRWLKDALGGGRDAAAESGRRPRASGAGRGGGDPAGGARPPLKNILVTGRPGVGKTTLIENIVAGLGVGAGGFTTREVVEEGARVGFSIADLRGAQGVLARTDLDSPCRVGRYGVNRADIERIGIPALDHAVAHAPLVVMDEIGRMEMCSEGFMEAVRRALDSPVPVLGTIQDRSNAFLDGIRERPDVGIVRVTENNRKEAATRVRALVERALAAARSR